MLRAYARGDADAAWRLLMTFGPGMHRVALRLSDDADQAEDVVQESLIRVLERSERFHGGSLGAWLRAVTVRVALNVRRSERRLADREADFAANTTHCPPNAGDPVLRDALRDRIASLPEGERCVFLLVEFEGWTHAEVASALDISAEASRQRLLKARQYLRTTLHSLRGIHE